MYSPLNNIKKNYVGIASFGGYNHTDRTQLGEWYEMKNISGKYAPLLTPRRSREQQCKLEGDVTAIIYKNNYYIYSTANGVILYKYDMDMNNGNTVISLNGEGGGEPLTGTLYGAEGGKPYHFIEIGNKVVCLNEDQRDVGYIEFGDEIRFTKIMQYAVRQKIGADTPAYYYVTTSQNGNAYQEYFKDANLGDIITPDPVAAGSMSLNADNLLNVCFRYCVEQDNGKLQVLDIQSAKTAAQIAEMTRTDYYIAASDKKLYKHDGPSGANIEITAPKIAVFVRNPYDYDGGAPLAPLPGPQKTNEGDYINLEIGYSINFIHPFAWSGNSGNYTYKTTAACNFQLRVVKYHEYGDDEETRWNNQYGWQYYYIVDYHAQMEEWLRTNNLFIESEPYTQPFISGAVYPTLQFDNYNPNDGPITATAMNIPTSGTKKFYPAYIKISNTFPAIDATLQHNNRIWGANNANNEIKASAQGNFINWDDYRGLVSDSYAVSIGSDGAFTASLAIDDYLFFFKEHSYTMLYGTRPSNFCTNTVEDIIGIDSAGAAGVQVIGKSAYYMGIDGRVYRFNGSESTCISAALGDERYSVLASTHSQDKYYLLLSKNGEKHIFVYHIATGVWYIEDADHIDTLENIRGQAVALSTTERNSVIESGGETMQITIYDTDVIRLDKWNIPPVEENHVEWFCVSGLLGLESDFYQFISNLKLTFESEVGAELEVLAQFDEDGAWRSLWKEVSKKKQTRTVKISVRRCEFMRLQLRGVGFSKIYRIGYMTEQGAEK